MRQLLCRVLASLLLVLGGASLAAAQTETEEDDSWRFYGALSYGRTWPTVELLNFTTSTDLGSEVAGSLGFEMPWLRWDVVEVAYDWGDTVVGGVKGSTSLLSLGTGLRIGPFGADYLVCPYVSLGFAGGRLDTSGPAPYSQFSDWGFEWSGGLGLEVKFLERLRVGARYRYRSLSIEFVETAIGDVNASLDLHTLSLEVIF
ncbi:MAG: outer membrane beta-barrel protein [Myxococcota bacterium]